MTIASALLTVILFMQPAMPEPPQFKARLLVANESIQPGGQTELLIEISVGKPWHIYHPIVLDTGLATSVEFTTSPGVTIGTPRFPAPLLGESAGLEYLEHSGTIRAVAPLRIAENVAPGTEIAIKADVSGLACVEMCLPVSTTATLKIPVTESPGKPANERPFATARESLAPALAEAPYIKGSEVRVSKSPLGIDEPAELIATIRVQKDHHIQDRNPGVDSLIPSRLLIEKIPGLEFAEEKAQLWPKPHERDMQYIGRVREQSGQFQIRVPLKITDPEFPTGPVTVRVLFHYQACTDAGQCFAPTWAEGFATLEAKTPNAPVVAEVLNAPDSPTVEPPDAEDTATTEPPADEESGGNFTDMPTPELAAEDWAESIPWQHWHPGWPEELARRGKLVYVDYTATWCLTCQTNKAAVLETDRVRTLMRDLGVIPIEADFTNKDPAMLAEIKKWNRPTVPLNIIYTPGKPDKVAVLPVLLVGYEDQVVEALNDPEAFADRGEKSDSLFLMILAGFLGGLILNVMPCVLPVISIKVLSFVQQAGEDPKRVFRLGLAFCAGIMVWFWAFAVLTSRGELPWQYPEVVVALGAILFIFALNLFGVFELMLPGAASGKLDALAAREGYTGAFLKGLLATLLGTACTAPFLAGAMAYALTQPVLNVFLVFTAAGLGMASPYLVLSAHPAWLKFIPKPGPWMITFKQATGFILLGTVVWLLWILAHQIDGVGVVWTVAFFGFLALGAWMIGKIKPTWQTTGRTTAWTASLAIAALGFYFCYFVMYDWNGNKVTTAKATTDRPTAVSMANDEATSESTTEPEDG